MASLAAKKIHINALKRSQLFSSHQANFHKDDAQNNASLRRSSKPLQKKKGGEEKEKHIERVILHKSCAKLAKEALETFSNSGQKLSRRLLLLSNSFNTPFQSHGKVMNFATNAIFRNHYYQGQGSAVVASFTEYISEKKVHFP